MRLKQAAAWYLERRYPDLKRKVSQVWDWNQDMMAQLDASIQLEKKSISSMRLKQHHIPLQFLLPSIPLKRKVSQVWDWNKKGMCWCWAESSPTWKEKYLKYEIETTEFWISVWKSDALEKKSISSMRLKLYEYDAKRSFTAQDAWKEKYLKYEIETPLDQDNDVGKPLNLKRKVSQVWDWNNTTHRDAPAAIPALKRKVSQVWDWNDIEYLPDKDVYKLEKKSISSMRLKRDRLWKPSGCNTTNLKRKVSQVWDWNRDTPPR